MKALWYKRRRAFFTHLLNLVIKGSDEKVTGTRKKGVLSILGAYYSILQTTYILHKKVDNKMYLICVTYDGCYNFVKT